MCSCTPYILNMKFYLAVFHLAGVIGLISSLSAITIELDYSYDTNEFFDQPGSKEAMRAVADFFEERLHDNLLEINQVSFGSGVSWSAKFTHPGDGTTANVPGLVVPADTIIVFVGGRNLGVPAGRGGPGGYSASGFNDWFTLLSARGQSGALDTPATDFGPWGGSLSFNSSRTWHFQLDSRPSTSASDFVSVALHELGHLLGIGTADSWKAFADLNNDFTGSQSMASFGGPVPLDPTQSHWQDDATCSFPLGYNPENPLNVLSLTYVSFGTEHAQNQIAMMDPSSCSITSSTILKVFTDLDFAGLSDLGWEVFQPLDLEANTLGPDGATFDWPSSTGQVYTLQRSTNLILPWESLTFNQAGNGERFVYSDDSPPAGKAFYRLLSSSAAASTPPTFISEEASLSTGSNHPAPSSRDPIMVDGCWIHIH